METPKINAAEIVDRLLASLVAEVANAVTAQLNVNIREMVADITNERLGELETRFDAFEHETLHEVDEKIESALDGYNFDDVVQEIVRGMDFTVEVR
jgi:hypothetical protein